MAGEALENPAEEALPQELGPLRCQCELGLPGVGEPPLTELGEDVVEVVLDDSLGLPVQLLHLGLEAEPLLLVGHPLQDLLEAPLGGEELLHGLPHLLGAELLEHGLRLLLALLGPAEPFHGFVAGPVHDLGVVVEAVAHLHLRDLPEDLETVVAEVAAGVPPGLSLHQVSIRLGT